MGTHILYAIIQACFSAWHSMARKRKDYCLTFCLLCSFTIIIHLLVASFVQSYFAIRIDGPLQSFVLLRLIKAVVMTPHHCHTIDSAAATAAPGHKYQFYTKHEFRSVPVWSTYSNSFLRLFFLIFILFIQEEIELISIVIRISIHAISNGSESMLSMHLVFFLLSS